MKHWILKTDGASTAPLIARLTLAIILFPHGAQKLLGWYGGYGFTGTMNFFTDVVHIPYIIGLLVIIIEFVGAFGLLTGPGTRLWAIGVIGNMIGIIFSSHIQNGFFMNWFGNQAGEGYEYHLLVIGLAVTLLITGGGKFSVDGRLAKALQ